MAISLDENTVTTSLWPMAAANVKSTGQVIQATLAGKERRVFSLVCFDTSSPGTFYACTSSAVVYVISLERNTARLFVTLELPITAMTCCNCREGSMFVCATKGASLVWFDCSTSRVLKRMNTAHAHAIHAIHQSCLIGNNTLLFTISNDLFAVWDAVKIECYSNSGLGVGGTTRSFLSLHTSNESIVTVERFGRVTLWKPSSLRALKSVVVALQPRTCAMCGTCIAIGGPGPLVGLLKMDDLSSIGCVQLATSTAAVRSLTFIDDSLLACELMNGTVVFVVLSNYTVSFSMEAPHSKIGPRVKTRFYAAGPSFAVFTQEEKLTVFHLPTVRKYYIQQMKECSAGVHSMPHAAPHSFILEKTNLYNEAVLFTDESRIGGHVGTATTLPRPAIKPTESQIANWITVDALPIGGQRGFSYREDAVKLANDQKLVSTRATKGGNSDESRATNRKGELSLRPFLDEESLVANMSSLKCILLRYGIFPEEYRAITWRFLLQLPDKRFTAPQYAQLLSRGPHPLIPALMKPFSLRNKSLQRSVEEVLSALAWHAPMFAAIHFLPMIVYPFLHVFKDDIQSTVEVVLIFLYNWGKEFFQFYPQHPVALTTLMDRLLLTEDAALHNHLSTFGVAVEWCWEPLQSVYSDIVTPAEWLQVMDHAFYNEPLWLFLFYVRWLVNVREDLMKHREREEIMGVLLSTHSVDINRVIGETYALQGRCHRGELTAPYKNLEILPNHVYPVTWKHNEENIAIKLKDINTLRREREQSSESKKRLASMCGKLCEAEDLEKAFIKKKHAEAAAHVITKTESWTSEIAREMEKRYVRDMERMLRVRQLRMQIEQTEQLEALKEQLDATTTRVSHINETCEKDAAHRLLMDQIEDGELGFLEEATRRRLDAAKRSIQNNAVKNEIPQELGVEDYERACPCNIIRISEGALDVAPVATTTNATVVNNRMVVPDPNNPVNMYLALRNSVASHLVGCKPTSTNGGNTPDSSPLLANVGGAKATAIGGAVGGLAVSASHRDSARKMSGRRSESNTLLYDNLLSRNNAHGESEALWSTESNCCAQQDYRLQKM
uniref:Uncharacterized protein TCIL3000_10_8310 n=1 Tax=Trypanosoma congolense (strain IL3000) TaxID=1068625 RepID=G0UXD8_TRYCI|nr:unnamed protein product [Trypanosoma congolense IL3000]